ncbi:tripartite tricarboxylate transporter TctB family protein [Larsenimonas rhizosphaerae]|uniref:Tripartite tricarboxylate transporter TctB family protein n=1 Tax=Larsenimonas rhizosphaerae TaxID=2944682 RepID=A0AA41ZF99_9GAMM|nr:tripartite tricarboxylate transporter TctB family protein [Larsenimonas rhizosphaerae]MCX2523561.1 tripartite tricarboxylate transporter TctB family protein [Larsenimonas rhizosphaerae]
MRINDRLFGALFLLLAVAYGWQAQQFPEPMGGSEAIGPSTFPTLLAVVLGLGSLYMMLKPDEDEAWPVGKTLVELIGIIVILVVYTALLETVGFVIMTTLSVALLSWRMQAPPLKALMTGLVSAVVAFVIFNYGLELTLPDGILELG